MMDNKAKAKQSLLLVALLYLFSALLFKIYAYSVAPNELSLKALSYCIALFSIIIINTLKRTIGTLLSITTMFVILFILFMFGQVLLYAFGIIDNGFLSGKFSVLQSMDGITDAQIYLSFFLMGVALSKRSFIHQNNYKYDKHGVKVGYWLIIISLPFEVFVTITKIIISSSYGYAALYQDVAYDLIPSSYKIMSYFFLPGIWYLYYCSEINSKHEKIAQVLLVWVCISYMIIGYRAMSILPLLLYMYAHKIKYQSSYIKSKIDRKKRITLYVLVSLIVLFIFPLVRYSRNSGGIENMNSSEISKFIANNELFSTVNDMGKSLQTVIYTKGIIPDRDDYRYGYTYIIASSAALPNLFWDRHPAETYGSLGRWLTKIVDPDFYNFGGALGYSCVAECYVNFGYIGLFIIPLIFGLLLSTLEKRIYRNNQPIGYASLTIVAFYLLFYPRGEFGELVRGIAWYMLIPFCAYKLTLSNK